uniref:Actin maturation protease n=1 Tax=Petromyzon marinus TaxID=7757 RepID=S4RK42_PETMA
QGFECIGACFNAFDMSRLAEDLFGCQVTLLQNGMLGENRSLIIEHLVRGQPLLIPYPLCCNYEPCNKRGHKAHWAVVTGALLGVDWSDVETCFEEVAETPGLYSAESAEIRPMTSHVHALYLLAKQGKSVRHRLWDFDRVAESNGQLLEFDPRRQADGTTYVVPAEGGVRAGLCGKLLLLAPATA